MSNPSSIALGNVSQGSGLKSHSSTLAFNETWLAFKHHIESVLYRSSSLGLYIETVLLVAVDLGEKISEAKGSSLGSNREPKCLAKAFQKPIGLRCREDWKL